VLVAEIFTLLREADYNILGATRNRVTILRKTGLMIAVLGALGAPQAVAGPLDAGAAGPPAVLSPPPTSGFSGFYGALSFGSTNGTLTVPPLGSDVDRGQALGLVSGYNWQRGALVYGGEVRVMQASGADWPAGGGIEAYDALFDLRGRAGLSRGDVLVYGALGVSWGSATPSAPAQDTDGLTFGLGVEYNVTERLFLGADVSRRDLSGNGGVEAEIDTLTLRGGFRF
jgi:outer membrane immunogenic protein